MTCEHGRTEGAFCPHCMGQGQMKPCETCGCIRSIVCVVCIDPWSQVAKLRSLLRRACDYIDTKKIALIDEIEAALLDPDGPSPPPKKTETP